METLDAYFKLFDDSRVSEESFNRLVALFSEDITFVLNGQAYHGIEAWKQFVRKVFEINADLKHMYDGWIENEDGSFQTRWAVCGKRYETGVYTQEGIDIAKLNEHHQITYLENKPDDSDLFSSVN
ncbi:polyketide cyclase [Staphylococcus gallinarum]|uniref:nuclear transport factor 2 family protein n=2 Tax=Staphylococcus gallinarum TaxID=1293 RepID=UPI000D1F962D|nr:nuclear transport factor 2 family protein [Staphylococcus gallinarum]MCD8844201.1 nuclear transport factor 2 family protein [Staphylococcus gallinarum]PTL18152.1 polyketide cyclase [Staphylococcus gallinarum]RIO80155.1 nuclear transport factor 2 family protein [Staphylococcus gallinarum]